MSGFSSPLTEAPTLSYSPSSLTSCSTVHTIHGTREITEEANLIFPVVYEKPKGVGPRHYIHTLIHLRHVFQDHSQLQLWGRLIPSTTDVPRQQFSAPPKSRLKDMLSLHTWDGGLVFIHLPPLSFAPSVLIIWRPAYANGFQPWGFLTVLLI